ncbi:Mu transposase C-terminal domain-containing protein [Streptomyces sp. NPDC102364]|uniref:Mu transposase C-terminal domain-containing protein n=1 Tax=Streptomyces sp. NPDC102364 TaxID=3366161 RepID=UPI00381ABD47
MDSANERARPDRSLRQASVRRLLYLEQHSTLTAAHVRIVADTFGVHPATVRRWLANARDHDGRYTPATRPRLTLTPAMRDAVARWCGNLSGAHKELKDEGHLTASYATFHRAVLREYTRGYLAGLRGGEQARRDFDIHPGREIGHRNLAWEGDHVEASVWVNVNGQRRKPWITWFIECSTNCICGLAVTPHTPSRAAILTALRESLLRTKESPFGGAPTLIRVDRGADYMSSTVSDSMGVFDVRCVDLPPRRPEYKGTVEKLNGAVKTMLFPQLPGYTHAPTPGPSDKPDPDEQLLTFKAFVAELRTWVHFWNFEHRLTTKDKRRGHTPAELWQNDLTPIYDVTPEEARTFTLEAAPGQRIISTQGIHWKTRCYVADWMTGRPGQKVTLRYLPHDFSEIEVHDAATGTFLGTAIWTNAATPEQKKAIRKRADSEAARLQRDLTRTNKRRRERFKTVTVPTNPSPLTDLTEEQADDQLRQHPEARPTETPRPDLRTPTPDNTPWGRGATIPKQATQTPPRHPATPATPSAAWHRTKPADEQKDDPADD